MRMVDEFLEDLAAPSRILTDVHRIATRDRLTSYDAAHLELALRRDLPLATLDEELQTACRASRIAPFVVAGT